MVINCLKFVRIRKICIFMKESIFNILGGRGKFFDFSKCLNGVNLLLMNLFALNIFVINDNGKH